MAFYVSESEDPVPCLYRNGFPGVFRKLAQMSQGLPVHLRYPKDLFPYAD
ncbi:MAG: hypothetical protein GWN86_07710 [Desulfobacterales bacterium]|nr:hypothetical protein [Desulfobacterales bacterium]